MIFDFASLDFKMAEEKGAEQGFRGEGVDFVASTNRRTWQIRISLSYLLRPHGLHSLYWGDFRSSVLLMQNMFL
jgi:hypothetical protein